jgi:hypothetical protein
MESQQSIFSLVRSMLMEYRSVYPKIWWIVPATFLVVAAQLIEPYVYKLLVDNLSGTKTAEGAIDVILPIVALW